MNIKRIKVETFAIASALIVCMLFGGIFACLAIKRTHEKTIFLKCVQDSKQTDTDVCQCANKVNHPEWCE